jgi:hypothetical protein
MWVFVLGVTMVCITGMHGLAPAPVYFLTLAITFSRLDSLAADVIFRVSTINLKESIR